MVVVRWGVAVGGLVWRGDGGGVILEGRERQSGVVMVEGERKETGVVVLEFIGIR